MANIDSRSLVLVLPLVLPLAGCGDVHGIPIDQTAREIAATVCPKAYECCTAEKLMGNELAGMSEPECQTLTAQEFRNRLQGIQRSIDQGRARYEREKVDACLQTIETSSCGSLNMTNHLTGVPGCDRFVTPLVAPGGECDDDYECIDGWCEQPAEGEPSGPRQCRAHLTGNLSCVEHRECGGGRLCHPDTHVCYEPKDPGASCTGALDCKSGICGTDPSSGSAVCMANTAPMCFYESAGCSAAGGSLPGPGTVLLLSIFAGIVLLRARRRADR